MAWHFEPINTLKNKTIAAEHFSFLFGLMINQQKIVVPGMSITRRYLKFTLLHRDSKSKEECLQDIWSDKI